jgi:hypothetical protein
VNLAAFTATNAGFILAAMVIAPAVIILVVLALRGYNIKIDLTRSNGGWFSRKHNHKDDNGKHEEGGTNG